MKNKIVTRSSDFRQLVADGCLYIDKTSLIEEVIQIMDIDVQVITRPHNFGKSVFLSMLECFFSMDEKDNQDILFKGLYIQKSEFWEYRGKFKVVRLSLERLKVINYEIFINNLRGLISDLYRKFSYLKNSGVLTEQQIKQFTTIEERSINVSVFTLECAISKLCEYIYDDNCAKKISQCKPIVLIDDFDFGLLGAHLNGFFDIHQKRNLLAILRSFLLNTLKLKDRCLVLITGVINLTGVNLLLGLDNIKYYSLIDNDLSKGFGFTSSEIIGLLRETNEPTSDYMKKYPELLKCYGHYYCGNQMLFNPWSIVKFIGKGQEITFQSFKSSLFDLKQDDFVCKILQLMKLSKEVQSREVQLKLKVLLENGYVEIIIDKSILYKKPEPIDLPSKCDNFMLWLNWFGTTLFHTSKVSEWFFNLLYLTGYLTAIPLIKHEINNKQYKLKLIIPNCEMFDYLASFILEKIEIDYGCFLDRSKMIYVFEYDLINKIFFFANERNYQWAKDVMKFTSRSFRLGDEPLKPFKLYYCDQDCYLRLEGLTYGDAKKLIDLFKLNGIEHKKSISSKNVYPDPKYFFNYFKSTKKPSFSCKPEQEINFLEEQNDCDYQDEELVNSSFIANRALFLSRH